MLKFQDHALEEVPNPSGPGFIYTGRVRQRLFLVLDSVSAHQFSEKGSELINLQHYVTKVKKVPEREAIMIFYDIVRVVSQLHKVRKTQESKFQQMNSMFSYKITT